MKFSKDASEISGYWQPSIILKPVLGLPLY